MTPVTIPKKGHGLESPPGTGHLFEGLLPRCSNLTLRIETSPEGAWTFAPESMRSIPKDGPSETSKV